MPDILIRGDTFRSPEMRHEVPVGIPDAFTYIEHEGRRVVVVTSFEIPRIAELGTDLEARPFEDFGLEELYSRGLKTWELGRELTLNVCREVGVTDAVVPATFPLDLADFLRENGIQIRVDRELFMERRRRKNDFELAGMRRAQRAAEAGMDAARELLRRADASNGTLTVDGEPLTVERIKPAVEAAFSAHGVAAEEFILSHGPQTAIGHDMGSGAIAPNEPIVIDLFPRNRETGCYADMTRTYVVGEISDELREYHRLSKEVLDRTLAATRAGVNGADLHRIACDLFHEHGYKSNLYKDPDEVLEDGFFHALGHGVGLEVHEQPSMGRIGEELVAGDVITLEPGLYRRGYGGVRLEDLVLVTEDGAENLTDYPYDLEP